MFFLIFIKDKDNWYMGHNVNQSWSGMWVTDGSKGSDRSKWRFWYLLKRQFHDVSGWPRLLSSFCSFWSHILLHILLGAGIVGMLMTMPMPCSGSQFSQSGLFFRTKVPTGALYPAECLGCPGAVGLSIAWCHALSPLADPQLPGATLENLKKENHRDRNL